jgi:hypothetical protein
VRHEPRRAVEAAIIAGPLHDFTPIESKVRDLLDEANGLIERRLREKDLELVKRAAVVIAHDINGPRHLLTVEALRSRVAPASCVQPPAGQIPSGPTIGNDTVRNLLVQASDLLEMATRIGWAWGDFHEPTAMTVFSANVSAGRDSHALAVDNGRLPMIGIGTGSFDSFVITRLAELVHGTKHDPSNPDNDPSEIARILELWGEIDGVTKFPMLDFEQNFELLISSVSRQHATFANVAPADDVARVFPPDIVVQRLPHGPYEGPLRIPAGEIMAREHPEMATVLRRHGLRGVLTYAEGISAEGEALETAIARLCDLSLTAPLKRVANEDIRPFQERRRVTVDVWNVDHYIVTGTNSAGEPQQRVARHARFDKRITTFETVSFADQSMPDAVVLAEYAVANQLRSSCIDASLNVRIKPGLLGASSPHVREGLRRLFLLGNAVTIAVKRRVQAESAR